MQSRAELEEIAHTGGRVSFDVAIDPEGRVSYSVAYRHSSPTAASMFAVYAIPQGVAVADIQLGGIGTPWNPPPIPDCFPVFISSDITGMFGHECPACQGYWRASYGGKVCPYCAMEVGGSHQFLTKAQKRYVKQYCDLLADALHSGKAGTHTIDMDAVAAASGKDHEKPSFYYAEERQQNLFTCAACGANTDVLGIYAYCGLCGTRNDFQELEKLMESIRARINAGGMHESCVKDAVSAFDSFADQYRKQLLELVPLTPARRGRFERFHFHNLQAAADALKEVFDIDIVSGISAEDLAFIRMMFHRRHVYEHKGGEADEKYIADSGDAVRPKQALRESAESAHRTVNVVIKLAKRLHLGFHEIFPPDEDPIERHRTRSRKQ